MATRERDGGFHAEQSIPFWVGHLDDRFRRAILAALRPQRITIPWWRTLAILAERGPMTMSEIAGLTLVERTALSKAIDRMSEQGLVRRESTGNDRRYVAVHLTDRGREVFAGSLPAVQAVYRRAVEGLSPAEIEAFRSTARRVLSNLPD